MKILKTIFMTILISVYLKSVDEIKKGNKKIGYMVIVSVFMLFFLIFGVLTTWLGIGTLIDKDYAVFFIALLCTTLSFGIFANTIYKLRGLRRKKNE